MTHSAVVKLIMIHSAQVVHVVPADFLPSVQVVIKKQDSSFRTEKSPEFRKTYSALVEYSKIDL